jgi:hypothetical protein
LIHHPQNSAAHQTFVFYKSDVRLDSCRVAVHHECDGARGGKNRHLGIAESAPVAYAFSFAPSVPCLTVLEARLKCAANDEQRACVADILKAAADAQAPDLLMSFDNDVAELLAERLCAQWADRAAA